MRGNYTVAGVTIDAGAVLNDDGNTLTVNGNVVINGQLGTNRGGALRMRTAGATLSGTGIVKDLVIEIDAANITLAAGSSLDFDPNAEIDVGANLAGSLTINGSVTAATQAAGDRVIRVSTGGTLAVGSTGVVNAPNSRLDVRTGATATNNGSITIQDLRGRAGAPAPAFTQGVNSTLNVSGALCAVANPCTFNASATGNTVNYTGAAQTGKVTTYNNLTLSGSGAKTFATTPTVNGVLSMEGTATVTVTTGVVTYGASATLQYNTATARTPSTEEWITPFAATGGVVIANTGAITLNAAKTLGASVPLIINSGATLANSTFALTLAGDFTQNGTFTAGSGVVTLNGGAAVQTLSGSGPLGFANLTVNNTGGITLARNVTVTSAIIGAVTLTDTCPTNWTLTSNGGLTVQHSCSVSPPNHYELTLAASSVACLASTVTVTACADTSSPCTNNYTTASGTTATLATNAGGLGSTTVTFNASGVATTTLSYPAAADGATATVTLSGEQAAATNPRKCCQGGTCTVANSCATTFNTAGFVFSSTAGGAVATIPAQTAGTTSSPYFLRAVKTNTTTQACEAALAGANTVNFAYECNNPATCSASNLMSINGGTPTTIARNNNGSVGSYTSVGVTFDTNGNAPLTFNYSDAGRVTLYASKAAGGSLLTALTGSSNAFAVAPASFTVVPAGPYIAGSAFSATVTAKDAGGNTTPNFGKEAVAESATISLGSRVAPTGANDCANGPCNGMVSGSVTLPWSGGVATASNLSYSEVGQITLAATLASASYLGSGLTATGTSGTVGAFVPAYFDTAVTQGCAAGSFTYSTQPFRVDVTARNATGGTTVNYSNLPSCVVCAKDVTLYDPAATTNFNGTNTIAATAFAAGVGSSSTVTYTLPTTPAAPAAITLRAIDASVTPNVSSSGHAEGAANIRSGRMAIDNMYGPPKAGLAVNGRLMYWDGSKWILNAADTCSGTATGNFTIGTSTACPALPGVLLLSASQVGTGGQFRVILTPPTPDPGTGRHCVLLNSNISYLPSPASAQETWGTFRAPYIYQRER